MNIVPENKSNKQQADGKMNDNRMKFPRNCQNQKLAITDCSGNNEMVTHAILFLI